MRFRFDFDALGDIDKIDKKSRAERQKHTKKSNIPREFGSVFINLLEKIKHQTEEQNITNNMLSSHQLKFETPVTKICCYTDFMGQKYKN